MIANTVSFKSFGAKGDTPIKALVVNTDNGIQLFDESRPNDLSFQSSYRYPKIVQDERDRSFCYVIQTGFPGKVDSSSNANVKYVSAIRYVGADGSFDVPLPVYIVAYSEDSYQINASVRSAGGGFVSANMYGYRTSYFNNTGGQPVGNAYDAMCDLQGNLYLLTFTIVDNESTANRLVLYIFNKQTRQWSKHNCPMGRGSDTASFYLGTNNTGYALTISDDGLVYVMVASWDSNNNMNNQGINSSGLAIFDIESKQWLTHYYNNGGKNPPDMTQPVGNVVSNLAVSCMLRDLNGDVYLCNGNVSYYNPFTSSKCLFFKYDRENNRFVIDAYGSTYTQLPNDDGERLTRSYCPYAVTPLITGINGHYVNGKIIEFPNAALNKGFATTNSNNYWFSVSDILDTGRIDNPNLTDISAQRVRKDFTKTRLMQVGSLKVANSGGYTDVNNLTSDVRLDTANGYAAISNDVGKFFSLLVIDGALYVSSIKMTNSYSFRANRLEFLFDEDATDGSYLTLNKLKDILA